MSVLRYSDFFPSSAPSSALAAAVSGCSGSAGAAAIRVVPLAPSMTFSASPEAAHMIQCDRCALWVTNEYQHSGLRDDGERVFTTLLAMTRGEATIPS